MIQHPTTPDQIPEPTSFISILAQQAARFPDQTGYIFLEDGESQESVMTYQQLHQQAQIIGAALQERLAPGDRALLLFAPGLNYIAAFMGCLYAGVIAVPIYPPNPMRLERTMPRLKVIITDAKPKVALTSADSVEMVRLLFDQDPTLDQLAFMATDALDATFCSAWQDPGADKDTIAFLQYTSGSTGSPKGVMVTHGNLIHNSHLIARCFGHTKESRGVIWLPPYHDMGLIGGILQPMHMGFPVTLMSPLAFLQHPLRWLQAISRYKATTSGGPNFAFDLCCRKVNAEQMQSLDLSHWDLAFNGAEPIRKETMERFTAQFANCGFRYQAFYPCYGLAEATLIVTGGQKEASPVTIALDPYPLARNRAVIAAEDTSSPLIFIGCGQKLPGFETLIVNPETRSLCKEGQIGEIWVAGPSVTKGYFRQPGKTRDLFKAVLSRPASRISPKDYMRTGDLGFFLDGELFITGRHKDMILIRGINHFPQDIELTVEKAYPLIRPGCVAAFSITIDGEERLTIVAEIERRHQEKEGFKDERRQHVPLPEHTPEYAYPLDAQEAFQGIREKIAQNHQLRVHAIRLIKVGSIPKTSSGKIQRFACRTGFLADTLETVFDWQAEKKSLAAEPAKAASRSEESSQTPVTIATLCAFLISKIARRLNIAEDQIDPEMPFAAMGLDSQDIVSLSGELESFTGRTLSPTIIFNHPTLLSLARSLVPSPQSTDEHPGRFHATGEPWNVPEKNHEPIAIIGLGCRFPKANSPQAFETLLYEGIDAIAPLPAARRADTPFDFKGGYLDEVALFDAQLFGISEWEASHIDPQQRLLLEVFWETMESAGIPLNTLAGSPTGVFVGISNSDYARITQDSSPPESVYTGTGNAFSIAANRISYLFDLTGPSLSVDTACSSSLTALHLAVNSLRNGECRLAVVGGVNLILADDLTRHFNEIGMLSPDNRSRAFDAEANGYVRGEGCGLILLKPLSQAQADGNRILALIEGSAMGQDGKTNGLTAPNGVSQERIIRSALQNAGIPPEAVSYIEAHGTGTKLGDPIEVTALKNVMLEGRTDDRPLYIGSVKTNIGHLESAAGIAGVIKTIIALQKDHIPPNLHFKTLNPFIPIKDTPVKIPCQAVKWPQSTKIAGVSSFGFGGTNVHVVLKAAPCPPVPPEEVKGLLSPYHLLMLSAKTVPLLEQVADQYHSFIDHASINDPKDLCYSVATGKTRLPQRLAVIGTSGDALKRHLAAFKVGAMPKTLSIQKGPLQTAPKIAFLFSGQGTHFPDMGKALYEGSPVFQDAIHYCAEILRDDLPRPLNEVMYPKSDTDFRLFDEPVYTQTALFALEFALFKVWESLGILPNVVMGHSIGEYSAAAVSGRIPLESALKLILHRGRLIQSLPPEGCMVAVFASKQTIAPYLTPFAEHIAIAAENGPELIVISGHQSAMTQVTQHFEADNIGFKSLAVANAFHSMMMDPILPEFEKTCADLDLRRLPGLAPPHPITFVSNLFGKTADWEVGRLAYWTEHLRKPVKFYQGMQTLFDLNCTIFIELGPSQVLINMGQACQKQAQGLWLSSLIKGEDDAYCLIKSLGDLFVNGIDFDGAALYPHAFHQKIPLPAYPFARKRYWLASHPDQPAPSRPPFHSDKVLPPAPPSSPRKADDASSSFRKWLIHATPSDRSALLANYLTDQVVEALSCEASQIDARSPLQSLGMTSLIAVALRNKIRHDLAVEIPIASFMDDLSIETLKQMILAKFDTRPSLPPELVPPRTESAAQDLTGTQLSIWLHASLADSSPAYNLLSLIRLKSDAEPAILENAFQTLFARHEILRTTYPLNNGEPIGQIHASMRPPFECIDASFWSQPDLDIYIAREGDRPFDLKKDPVLRIKLILGFPGMEKLLVITAHHIAMDLFSMEIFLAELKSIYSAFKSGLTPPPPTPALPFASVAQNLRNHLSSEKGSSQNAFWTAYLGGVLPRLALPYDYPRPSVPHYHGKVHQVPIDPELFKALAQLSQEAAVTPFILFLAAFHLLLHRYSQQTEFLTATPVSHRDLEGSEKTIGCLVDLLVLRNHVDAQATFAAWLTQTHATVREVFQHQPYPFQKILEQFQTAADAGGTPLIQAVFGWDQLSSQETLKDDNDLVSSVLLAEQRGAAFDLTVLIVGTGTQYTCNWHYNTEVFEEITITRMAQNFLTLLASIHQNPDAQVSGLPLISPAERELVLFGFNQTQGALPLDKTLGQRFEDQAASTPDQTAILFKNERLTYLEVNTKANQVAHYLSHDLSIAPGDPVAVFLDPSPDLLIAILGILKMGGIYIPADPNYPSERIAYILGDCGAKVLITQGSHLEAARDFNISQLMTLSQAETSPASPPAIPVSSEAPAYIIYTSGSTGAPKGCINTHQGLINMSLDQIHAFGITRKDAVLQFASFSFDASLYETFMTFLAGATLVIADREITGTPSDFAAYLTQHGVTVATLPPLFLTTLKGTPLNTIKTLITAGEAAIKDEALYYSQTKQYINAYGPSEASVCIAYHRVTAQDALFKGIPIGKPITNMAIYLLDDTQNPVPIGAPGEICVSGIGVGLGYLNRPELTRERFVPDPLHPAQRMYRTGDLGRFRHDGTIEFMGRIDDQVKIRGYRVEPSEIEAQLLALDQVSEACVIARKTPQEEMELTAYLKTDAPKDTASLREALGRHLPDYMLPSFFVYLDAFPTTPNGKIDKKALPHPTAQKKPPTPPFSGREKDSGDATDREVLKIWQEVLGIDTLHMDDDFFDNGGHSLKATRIISRIQSFFKVKLSIRDIFNHPSPRALSDHLKRQNKWAEVPLVPAAPASDYPLSHAQKRLYVLSQLGPGHLAYHIPGALMLTGPLSHQNVKQALERLVRRHESLRTVFCETKGEPRQKILDHLAVDLTVQDLSDQATPLESARDLAQQFALAPFDLAQGPLFRVALFSLTKTVSSADCQHLLVFIMHHIISDAWSMGVLINEFSRLYDAPSLALPPLALQYKDYTCWQYHLQTHQEMVAHRAYWHDRLKGDLAVLSLPTDFERPRIRAFTGQSLSFSLPLTTLNQLRNFNTTHDVSLFMTLAALCMTLLHRYSGQDEILLGTPVAGRNHLMLEDAIGFFVNTLVLRGHPSFDLPFVRFLADVKQDFLEALDHQEYPFDRLVDELHIKRDMSRNPIFDAMIVLQNAEMGEIQLEDIHAEAYPLEYPVSKFDLTFSFEEKAHELKGQLEFNTSLFAEERMRQMVQHLKKLMESVLATPETPLGHLRFLADSETRRILEHFNATATNGAPPQDIVSHFADQAAKTPNGRALQFHSETMTYRELDQLSQSIAGYLMEKHAIAPEDRLAVLMERSHWPVIALLSILKCGGAYVPIDPAMPEERIRFILTDSQAKVLLTDGPIALPHATLSGVPVIDIKTLPRRQGASLLPHPKPNQLAYVIYTSGSTGFPKGVLIEHQGFVNMITSQIRELAVHAADHVLQFASCAFDGSMYEIFLALLSGACLHPIAAATQKDPQRLQDLILADRITIAALPPGYIEVMGFEKLESLRVLITAGDQAVPPAPSFVTPHRKYYNLYGPTEASVTATYYAIDAPPPPGKRIPIGQPVSGTEVLILAPDTLTLQPIGVFGEICLAGMGLARGYLNRPELTDEKFVCLSEFDGKRFYRTGDLGRWLPDGAIEFLGRNDFQVKIRGHRIEVSEIENSLLRHDDIKEAVVIVHTGEEDTQSLAAYFVAKTTLAVETLRQHLSQTLPDYMLPMHYTAMEEMPRTPSGKIDRARLPAISRLRPQLQTDCVPPHTPTEKTLAAIWQQVLHLESVGIHDNFFDLGGHSLLMIQVLSQLKDAFQMDLELVDLFTYPTIHTLSEYIEKNQTPTPAPSSGKEKAQKRSQFQSQMARRRQRRQKKQHS